MSVETTDRPASDEQAGAKTVTYSPAAAPVYAEGRRDFIKYRDLGVTQATDGRMHAQLMLGKTGLTRPTGWHYHVCEQQFVYIIKGELDLEFEDGTELHMVPGDSALIPGGLRHNETALSDDFELIEVTLPSDMRTVKCDPPEGAKSGN